MRSLWRCPVLPVLSACKNAKYFSVQSPVFLPAFGSRVVRREKRQGEALCRWQVPPPVQAVSASGMLECAVGVVAKSPSFGRSGRGPGRFIHQRQPWQKVWRNGNVRSANANVYVPRHQRPGEVHTMMVEELPRRGCPPVSPGS